MVLRVASPISITMYPDIKNTLRILSRGMRKCPLDARNSSSTVTNIFRYERRAAQHNRENKSGKTATKYLPGHPEKTSPAAPASMTMLSKT